MQEWKEHLITSADEYREGAVAVFRQQIPFRNIVKATLYITALGVYEAEINGVKAGRQMFAPGYTYYPRRLLYQEYDITGLLSMESERKPLSDSVLETVKQERDNHNEITVYLGQGWYAGRFLCENKNRIYGDKPAVSWEIVLEDTYGAIQKIVSDTQVEELESPYEYAGEYDGEIYHGKGVLQKKGNALAYGGKLPNVYVLGEKADTAIELQKTLMEVRVQEEMPIQKESSFKGRTILDFGQNFAGIVEIDPAFLQSGDVITIRHGEILNADGSLYTNNLRKAKAAIQYTAGEEKRKYRPRFTYMGFRYMEVSGAEYKPGLIRAYAVTSQMERTGSFTCGNQLVQKLYDNQVWGQKSNYVEVPTDCPQRDERMGYTGDGHVFALTGAYNFDTRNFWKNFLTDLRLSQMDNSEGYVGATVPAAGPTGIGFISMLGWGNAVTLLPEMMYWQFGDEEALPDQYESMKLFVEAEICKMGRKNLWIGPSLGDWLAPGKGMAWQAVHNNPVSNSFIVHDLEVLSNTAEVLGRKEDELRYREQLEKTRNAYLKKYLKKNGEVAGDYQSAYIMALKFVIPKGELRKKVLERYVENVRKNGMETGFFATQHFLPLLVEAGEAGLAYDMLLQEKCPGWMYQVKCGATTTWERWDALKPDGTVNEEKVASSGENMVSFNHYAFGSVGEFYYQYILGIRPLEPGYKKLLFQPVPDRRLGCVSGSFLSRRGRIDSRWCYEEEEVVISLTTPVEALVVLPDGKKETVKAGSYTYHVK